MVGRSKTRSGFSHNGPNRGPKGLKRGQFRALIWASPGPGPGGVRVGVRAQERVYWLNRAQKGSPGGPQKGSI